MHSNREAKKDKKADRPEKKTPKYLANTELTATHVSVPKKRVKS